VNQQKSLFTSEIDQSFRYTAEHVATPLAYDGVLAFHKYWGKKPVEPLAFMIERLTETCDLVVDPFSGSGVTGFAAVTLKRRYLGIDINPIASKLSSLVLSPPPSAEIKAALDHVARITKRDIEDTYVTGLEARLATHYLWDRDKMKEIWIVAGRRHATLEPTEWDTERFERYESYLPRFRNPRFFQNSRINAEPTLTWGDLFTGRALRNIELLLEAIRMLPDETRSALELCLTAALGQMSKMVFAITGRGKTSGAKAGRIEVGSWVIGFWRPPLHFEVNVWNCFQRKVEKLLSGAPPLIRRAVGGSVENLLRRTVDFSITTDDAIHALSQIPDRSIKLILTDPPHSDRAPYLELSELWNAILDLDPQYSDEIVVSNAKGRGKNVSDYNARMKQLAAIAVQKLDKNGSVAVQFNARDKLSWEFLRDFESSVEGSDISYRGTFPLLYSANSVVQDNRKGALTTDDVLIFASADTKLESFSSLPNWTCEYPTKLRVGDAVNL
jgi:hypothetical protein